MSQAQSPPLATRKDVSKFTSLTADRVIVSSPPISLACSPTAGRSSLPLPSLRHNRSFAKLAKLLGLSSQSSNDEGDSGSIGAGNVNEDGDGDGEDDEEGEDEEGEDEIDEDSLLWDAQTALISHQPALAVQHYTQAALPPHHSSAACLALGNLLTRGSSLAPTSPTISDPKGKGKSRAYSFASSPTSPTSPTSPISLTLADPGSSASGTLPRFAARLVGLFAPPPTAMPNPVPEKTYTDLVATGWAIPTDGKRAVRDVEGMGVAGGWYVLGLGWIVDRHNSASFKRQPDFVLREDGTMARPVTIHEVEDDDVIRFGSRAVKRSTRSRTPIASRGNVTLETSVEGMDKLDSSSDGTIIKTPADEDGEEPVREQMDDPEAILKLLYDLLTPLTRLYRNGHIQSADPVYLPPIIPSQLPVCLRPQGDSQKRRNVWHLGGQVARHVLDTALVRKQRAERGLEARRIAVNVLAHYVLGMTCPPTQSARHFRTIVSLGHSGFDYPDDLIRQASKRLETLHRSPEMQGHGIEGREYPFPRVYPSSSINLRTPRAVSSPTAIRPVRHGRNTSISTIRSTFSSRITGTPIKASPSMASLTTSDLGSVEVETASMKRASAVESLRAIRLKEEKEAEAEEPHWPVLGGWSFSRASASVGASVKVSPEETPVSPPVQSDSPSPTKPIPPRSRHPRAESDDRDLSPSHSPRPFHRERERDPDRLAIPSIRYVASTPTLGTLRASSNSSAVLTPRPFDDHNRGSDINLRTDPVLAAAELASALTKHVHCSVCSAKGVNFPECRRCGLVFCSRECRVQETGAGNGKKHVCGAWEGRRLLAPPEKDARGKIVGQQQQQKQQLVVGIEKRRGSVRGVNVFRGAEEVKAF